MSVRFRHSHLPQPLSPASRISRPHTASLDAVASSFEIVILILLLGILIILLCWVTWIRLQDYIRFVQGNLEQRSQTKRNDHQTEIAPRSSWKGSMSMKGITRGLFTGLSNTVGENYVDETGIKERLLEEMDGKWYDGVKTTSHGRRERLFGDGNSDSSGATVVHRDDCEGTCGLQSKRRSRGS